MGAKEQPVPPSDDEIPSLALALSEKLRNRTVKLPDGSWVPIIDSSAERGALLTQERIETCLSTVSEAGAWPSAWLVIQVRTLPFDLVMPVRLDEDGRVEDPDPVFTVERREWDVEGLRTAIREETDRKPRGRAWSLVVQSFTKRIVDHYVYNLPDKDEPRKGLMALMPEGSLLREARSVNLGDGRPHTLAIVLQEAEFLPSSCEGCAAKLFGHADTGKILLALAGENELEDSLDLTDFLKGEDGRPLLARYGCEENDRTPDGREGTIDERFSKRPLLELMRLDDLDGDGQALEFSLPSSYEDCGSHEEIILGVDADEAKLRVVSGVDSSASP